VDSEAVVPLVSEVETLPRVASEEARLVPRGALEAVVLPLALVMEILLREDLEEALPAEDQEDPLRVD